MQKPTIGRIVHYVLSAGDAVHSGSPHYRSVEGDIAPAIIVAVWGETCVNLIVFLDGSNHGLDKQRHPDKPGGFENVAAINRWATSRCYSEGNEPGTWHWPPREEQPAQPPDPRSIVGIHRGAAREVPEQLLPAETARVTAAIAISKEQETKAVETQE